MIQHDPEIGNYMIEETGNPYVFNFLIERGTGSDCIIDYKLDKIIEWWNGTGFGKQNWMHLQESKQWIDRQHENFYHFRITFSCSEDLMAFKLRWL